jgi:hypothetical protein
MDMSNSGPLGHRGDVAMDGAPVEGLAVVSFDQVTRAWSASTGPVVDDEVDKDRVQRHVAVVVELAHGDAQPVELADADHGVVFEGRELADAHAGAGQEFNHEATAPVGVRREGGHELGRRGVVQVLGQRLVEDREVALVDQQPARRVVVAVFDEALEEGAEEAEALADRLGGQGLAAFARAAGQPAFVVLDVATLGVSDRPTGRVERGDPRSEEPQGELDGVDRARARRHGQLVQVGGDGGAHLGRSGVELAPRDLGGPAPTTRLCSQCCESAHWATPTSAWASMASAALRYSAASQLAPRCR